MNTNTKKKLRPIYGAIVAILAVLILAPACSAQDKSKSQKLAPVAPPPAVQGVAAPPAFKPVSSPEGAFVQYAQSMGIKSCLGRIEQIGKYLIGDSKNVGGFLFVPSPEPDKMLASLSMEIPQPGNVPAYASASFAPNQANGCGGMYETVVYFPQDCETVAAKNYPNLKRDGVLSRQIVILNGGPALRFFLMPAGNGCVSIKKEVVQ